MTINRLWLIGSLLIINLFSFASRSQPLLLTGIVGSAQKQTITAPRTSRWLIQIQWMEDEGKIVNKGDLVLVFDGANEQSQLEQNEERLSTLILELSQIELEQRQKVADAQGALLIAEMRVEEARIEAELPAAEISEYDLGQYKLALQRALGNKIKAQEKLLLAQKEQQTSLRKKQIDIQRVEEEIAYLNSQLAKLNVRAQYTGPVSYAMHPWNGSKLSAGINVQAAWQVMTVQATDNYQVSSWVHEIDAQRIKQGDQVELTLDAFPEQRFTGTVSYLSTQAEKKELWSASAYYPLTIEFSQQPNLKLLPGMSVRIVSQGKTK